MEENNNSQMGSGLKRIRKNDPRTRIVFDEETGDFIIKSVDDPLKEGQQDATDFAKEGFA